MIYKNPKMLIENVAMDEATASYLKNYNEFYTAWGDCNNPVILLNLLKHTQVYENHRISLFVFSGNLVHYLCNNAPSKELEFVTKDLSWMFAVVLSGKNCIPNKVELAIKTNALKLVKGTEVIFRIFLTQVLRLVPNNFSELKASDCLTLAEQVVTWAVRRNMDLLYTEKGFDTTKELKNLIGNPYNERILGSKNSRDIWAMPRPQ